MLQLHCLDLPWHFSALSGFGHLRGGEDRANLITLPPFAPFFLFFLFETLRSSIVSQEASVAVQPANAIGALGEEPRVLSTVALEDVYFFCYMPFDVQSLGAPHYPLLAHCNCSMYKWYSPYNPSTVVAAALH